MRKRRFVIGWLTGLLAAVVFAVPARAEVTLTGDCLTQGTVKTNPPIPFTGGTGNYTFNDLALSCVGAEIQSNGVVSTALVTLDITSRGTYTNIICGTGKAVSGWNGNVISWADVVPITGTYKTNTLSEWADVVAGAEYTIEFVSQAGLLKWLDYAATHDLPEFPKMITAGPAGLPGGSVDIAQDETKSLTLPSACTKAWQAIALMSITITPSAQETKPEGSILDQVPDDLPDPPDLPPPPPPPTEPVPSDTCQVQGGAAAVGEGGNVGFARAKVFVWQQSPTKVHVCVRAQDGSGAGAGGMATIDATGSPGMAPLVEQSDTGLSECDTLVFEDEPPTMIRVTRSGASVPGRTSLCVEAPPSVAKRVTLGATGSLNPPDVIWTPDPDTPGQ